MDTGIRRYDKTVTQVGDSFESGKPERTLIKALQETVNLSPCFPGGPFYCLLERQAMMRTNFEKIAWSDF